MSDIIVPVPIAYYFEDEDAKMFYEVARTAGAYLVTGNIKHFPKEPMVVVAQEFINLVNSVL
ncbi:MAG: hypothetical protein Q7J78_05715 [Clostridiales bacterium]|nr:hypothetical protein [Clostridiales bacterium]